MKPVQVILIGILPGFLNITLQAQSNHSSVQPNTQYKVNRQFDDRGNIIGYDSTSITVWNSDNSILQTDSTLEYFFGDSLPNDEFVHSLDTIHSPFEFGFPNIDNFFGNSVSKNRYSQNDSLNSTPNIYDPFLDFGFSDPFGDENFSARIQEMYRRMQEMMEKQMQQFYNLQNSPSYNFQPNDNSSDSVSTPIEPKKNSLPKNKNKNSINI